MPHPTEIPTPFYNPQMERSGAQRSLRFVRSGPNWKSNIGPKGEPVYYVRRRILGFIPIYRLAGWVKTKWTLSTKFEDTPIGKSFDRTNSYFKFVTDFRWGGNLSLRSMNLGEEYNSILSKESNQERRRAQFAEMVARREGRSA